MIYNFKDYVNELWYKGLTRKTHDEKRLEDGKYVMTKMGVKIYLHNPNFDYESLISDIINSYSFYTDESYMDILPITDIKYLHVKLSDLKNDKLYYTKLLNSQNVISFEDYHTLLNETYLLEDIERDVREDDYISICQGITNMFKKTEVIHKKFSHYYFLLVGENDVYSSTLGDEDSDDSDTYNSILDMFTEDFENKFKDVDLDFFSYDNYAPNIMIPINYDNLINYDKMKKFAESYFNIH